MSKLKYDAKKPILAMQVSAEQMATMAEAAKGKGVPISVTGQQILTRELEKPCASRVSCPRSAAFPKARPRSAPKQR